MGGPALFAGSTHQSRLIAFVTAHVLAESRLGWIETIDDTPIAVWGETGAAGDDIRVEVASGRPDLEVQARHGLAAGARLAMTIEEIANRSTAGERGPVLVVVDQTSSTKVRRDVADDLNRMRAGRPDALRPETVELRSALGQKANTLARIHIVQCDVDRSDDFGRQIAREKLERVLFDPKQSVAAWHLLDADGAEISARRSRRDRKYLVALLKAAGIETGELGPNAEWHRQLDFSRRLLERGHADAALKHVRELEQELSGKEAEPRVWYRVNVQKANAFFALNRLDEAETSARRALDTEHDGIQALILLARIASELGHHDEAVRMAERAAATHADDPAAWISLAEARVGAGLPLPDAPPGVAETSYYRLGLCGVAVQQADWERAATLGAELMAEGRRDHQLLLWRAQGLHNSAEQGAPDGPQRSRDAARITSDLIDEIDDPANPLTLAALILRVSAHMTLEETDLADIDLAAASKIDPGNPEVIRLIATRRVLDDDPRSALEILQHPAAQSSALLLAMRADVRVLMSDPGGARRDLDASIALLPTDDSRGEARVRAGLVALRLDDANLADQIVEGMADPKSGTLLILRARIAIVRGRFEEARRNIESAIGLKPSLRTELMTMLASLFLEAGAAGEAVGVFDELGDRLPEDATHRYVVALIKANQLVRARAAVDRALRSDRPPAWALGEAANLAMRQSDPTEAARFLTILVERGDGTPDARIGLVLCLLQIDRVEEANPYLDALRDLPSLTPDQLMKTAELLCAAGRAPEAIPLAFRAARRTPDNPRILRAFAGLVLTSGVELPRPEEVTADTHVVLRNAAGAAREFTVLADGPVDNSRNELTVHDASARGLLKLAVGGVQVDNPGRGYLEERWTVEAIVPAAAHAAHDVLKRFQERFPGEPFFVRAFQFSTNEPGDLRDFVPFIASIEEKRKYITDVLSLYRAQVLPLGAIAHWVGGSVGDLMAQLTRDPSGGELLVEWVDGPGQERSRAAAREATKVVVTRSALVTAAELGILDELGRSYGLVAPASLELELRHELEEAQREVRDGHRSLGPGPVGFAMKEFPPNDPVLVARESSVRGALEWLRRSTEVKTRPLAMIGAPGSEQEKGRETLGASSYDALELAHSIAAPVYADDLGLRRFATKDQPPASFSSIAMLAALVERGIMTAERRDALLVELVVRRYSAIRPSAGILTASLRRPQTTGAQVELAFDLLAPPVVDFPVAARIGAEAIRAVILLPIRIISPADMARRVLRSMAKRWPPVLCAAALYRAAEEPLRFFPKELEQVRHECTSFAARSFEVRT